MKEDDHTRLEEFRHLPVFRLYSCGRNSGNRPISAILC